MVDYKSFDKDNLADYICKSIRDYELYSIYVDEEKRLNMEFIKKEKELKILPEYFEDIKFGLKDFELRKNDRDYKVGDIIVLKEYDDGMYTGRKLKKKIKYVLTGCEEFGLKEGYCILGLRELEQEK